MVPTMVCIIWYQISCVSYGTNYGVYHMVPTIVCEDIIKFCGCFCLFFVPLLYLYPFGSQPSSDISSDYTLVTYRYWVLFVRLVRIDLSEI